VRRQVEMQTDRLCGLSKKIIVSQKQDRADQCWYASPPSGG
jgi:hypothetical protein